MVQPLSDDHRASYQDEHTDTEEEPLLQAQRQASNGNEDGDDREVLDFKEDDPENPRKWSRFQKMLNVATIASMAILSPLASSMFTPGIDQIAEGLNTTTDAVIGCTTGFVIMLGIGPLLLVARLVVR